jgi:segregation and condensation protein B
VVDFIRNTFALSCRTRAKIGGLDLVLTAIAYFQPITRCELSQLFGEEVSHDITGNRGR